MNPTDPNQSQDPAMNPMGGMPQTTDSVATPAVDPMTPVSGMPQVPAADPMGAAPVIPAAPVEPVADPMAAPAPVEPVAPVVEAPVSETPVSGMPGNDQGGMPPIVPPVA